MKNMEKHDATHAEPAELLKCKPCQKTFLAKNRSSARTVKTIVFDAQGIYIYRTFEPNYLQKGVGVTMCNNSTILFTNGSQMQISSSTLRDAGRVRRHQSSSCPCLHEWWGCLRSSSWLCRVHRSWGFLRPERSRLRETCWKIYRKSTFKKLLIFRFI